MLQSLDTNILLYAINADCPEHGICADLVNRALQQGDEWIIADQVWFELYRLLRNPAELHRGQSSTISAPASPTCVSLR
jgi:predicted nucleic acid-binding protein